MIDETALESLGCPLPDGLKIEVERGAPSLDDPETATALEGYARGTRPEPPRG